MDPTTRIRFVVRLNTPEVLELLCRKNMTKTEFAGRIRVKLQYVYMLMNGKRNPSGPLRDKIQSVFPGQPWERLFRIMQ